MGETYFRSIHTIRQHHAPLRKQRFEAVTIQSASMDGAAFRHCTISGTLRNMIWRGTASGSMGKMVIEDCDLSEALFDNVNIYAGLNLARCQLPRMGIRVFNNHAGAFSNALREAAASLGKEEGGAMEVLGNETCYAQQQTVVFDIFVLEDMLDTNTTKDAFEAVAKHYEITQRVTSAIAG